MKHLSKFKLFENNSDELDDIMDILQRIGETAPILVKLKEGYVLGSHLIKFNNKINPSKEELDNVNDHLKSIGWEIISTYNDSRLDEFTFFVMESKMLNAYKSKGLKTIEDFSFENGYGDIKIGDEEISIKRVDSWHTNNMFDVSCSDENILFKFNSKLFCNLFIINKQIKYFGIKSYFDKSF